jgi:flagellar motor component MotA
VCARAEGLLATFPGVANRRFLINPVTNRLYVRSSSELKVVDGSTHAVTTILSGLRWEAPRSIS